MLPRLFGAGRSTPPTERLGLNSEVAKVADVAMSDFIFRNIVHSALVVLAVCDIARHGFYHAQVDDLLERLPSYLSWTDDITAALGPSVSAGFGESVGDAATDQVVAVFAEFYLTRLPVLLSAAHPFADVPQHVGFSKADARRIAIRTYLSLEDGFPGAWQSLAGTGPEDPAGIHVRVAEGHREARWGESPTGIRTGFIRPRGLLIDQLVTACVAQGLSPNMAVFLSSFLEARLNTWWQQFQFSYRDTFKDWLHTRAFSGLGEPAAPFWIDLEERVRKRDWLVRAAVGWG